MTRLDPSSVLGLVLSHDYPDDQVIHALAQAFAFSGGSPGAEHSPLLPGTTHRIGLFGVPLGALPWADRGHLYDPTLNSLAAFQLYSRSPAGWEWAVALQSPRAGVGYALARQALLAGPKPLSYVHDKSNQGLVGSHTRSAQRHAQLAHSLGLAQRML